MAKVKQRSNAYKREKSQLTAHPADIAATLDGQRLIATCACGARVLILKEDLLSGAVRSCGCMRRAIAERRSGSYGPRDDSKRANRSEYTSWLGMIRRCENAGDKAFAYYGGRGIMICARWRASFDAFLTDMGPRPPGLSIDRIDVNGNYEPGNCRWTDATVQSRNRRSAVMVTRNGETLNMSAWAERAGLRQELVHARTYIGWSIEEALSTPLRGKRRST